MKACKHCWRVNLQDAKKCVGCGATEFLDIIEIEKEGNMNIKEVESRLKKTLPKDMRVTRHYGNLTLEGEEPVMGWKVYTYWDLDGHTMGLAASFPDSFLGKIKEKHIDTISNMIQSARERYKFIVTD